MHTEYFNISEDNASYLTEDAAEIQDGLTIYLSQGETVIDCCTHLNLAPSNEVITVYVIDYYEHQSERHGQPAFHNFSDEAPKFSEYAQTAQFYFVDEHIFKQKLAELITNDSHLLTSLS